MNQYQPGILQAIPSQACYLQFNLTAVDDFEQTIKALESIDCERNVVGIAQSAIQQLGQSISGMKIMPDFSAENIIIPAGQSDLWCWLRGEDRRELLHRARYIRRQLAPAFVPVNSVDAYQYAEGRDLTGYIDGTENPQDNDALEAAILNTGDPALNGSSFVAVQQWQHDLDCFESFDRSHQDNIIGRHRENNEEFDEAPASAHVKRTAQESFNPEAFLLRRSMPWSGNVDAGLMFVAFARSFDAFEAQMGRMIGQEDGITDGLFEFSRVLEGHYFWCPPIADGRLLLTALI